MIDPSPKPEIQGRIPIFFPYLFILNLTPNLLTPINWAKKKSFAILSGSFCLFISQSYFLLWPFPNHEKPWLKVIEKSIPCSRDAFYRSFY
jgi:hypothetical protein